MQAWLQQSEDSGNSMLCIFQGKHASWEHIQKSFPLFLWKAQGQKEGDGGRDRNTNRHCLPRNSLPQTTTSRAASSLSKESGVPCKSPAQATGTQAFGSLSIDFPVILAGNWMGNRLVGFELAFSHGMQESQVETEPAISPCLHFLFPLFDSTEM